MTDLIPIIDDFDDEDDRAFAQAIADAGYGKDAAINITRILHEQAWVPDSDMIKKNLEIKELNRKLMEAESLRVYAEDKVERVEVATKRIERELAKAKRERASTPSVVPMPASHGTSWLEDLGLLDEIENADDDEDETYGAADYHKDAEIKEAQRVVNRTLKELTDAYNKGRSTVLAPLEVVEEMEKLHNAKPLRNGFKSFLSRMIVSDMKDK